MASKSTQPTVFSLPNGMRIVHKPIKSTQLVHCGLFINTGSRDEDVLSNGSAHFIEHALFKGTAKRRASQLFNRIESVGGELNAYTTREITAYYSSSLKRYVDRSFDLLSDMCFNSLLDPKELDKERKVIFEEIEMYEDSPDDSIYDEFFSMLFKDHPLGYNILGTKKSLAGIGQPQLKSFINRQYQPENIVFAVTGNVSLKRTQQLASQYLNFGRNGGSALKRIKANGTASFQLELEKDFQQTHCILGGKAYHRHDPKRYSLLLMNNLLGGNNMGSRLNLSVREKYGFCYHISSSYQAFDDTGVFFVSFGCDSKNLRKTVELVNKEFKLLKTKKLGPVQLNKAKRQLQGNLAMMAESPSLQMQSLAKSLLNYNGFISLDEIFERIEEVSAHDVMEVANELLAEENVNKLVFLGDNE